MATTTLNNKQFLDYAGLARFWDLLKGKFVAGAADATYSADQVAFDLLDANNAKLDTVIFTAATATQAGIMSATQADTLNKLATGDSTLIPFAGLTLGEGDKAADVTLKDRKANIDLAWVTETVTGADGKDDLKKYIVLKDVNGNATSTKLDVSEFVIDGILESSDVKIQDGKPFLVLDFKLADGTTKSETIDLSGLVDVYTAADGSIKIDGNTIKVQLATPAEGKKNYLETVAGGLTTSDALVTDYTNAAADAATIVRTEIIGEDGNGGKLAVVKSALEQSIGANADAIAALQAEDAAIRAAIGVPSTDDAEATGLYEVIEDNEKTTAAALNDLKAADAEFADDLKDLNAKVDAAIGDGGSIDAAIEAAVSVINGKLDAINAEIGDPAADGKPATGLYNVIGETASALDSAAQKYADDAEDAANTYTDNKFTTVVGTVTEGKTVVGLIGEAEDRATTYATNVYNSITAIEIATIEQMMGYVAPVDPAE